MRINYAELRPKLVRYAATKMQRAQDVAEDMAQEALLTVFRHQDRFTSTGHAQAYGFLSVRHKCIEEDRMRRKFFTERDGTLERILPAPDNQYQALLLDQMLEYIERMDNDDLDAVLASAMGYENYEIAKTSEFRKGVDPMNAEIAVRARIKRGRAQLKGVFG